MGLGSYNLHKFHEMANMRRRDIFLIWCYFCELLSTGIYMIQNITIEIFKGNQRKME